MRCISKKEQGITLWITIPIMLIIIGMVVTLVIMLAEKQEIEHKRDYLKEKIKEVERENDKLKMQIYEAVLPYLKHEGEPSTLPVEKAQKFWSEKRELYMKQLLFENIGNIEENKRRNIEEGIKNTKKNIKENIQLLETLEEMVAVAARRVNFSIRDAERWERFRKSAEERKKAAEKRKPEIIKVKDQEIAKYKQMAEELNNLIKKEEAGFPPKKLSFETQIADVDKQTEEAKNKHAEKVRELEDKIKDVDSRIKTVMLREWFTDQIYFVHGRLTKVDSLNKIAFIDIGSANRVVPGLKFLIGKKGGVYLHEGNYVYKPYIYKAEIEVQRVWQNTSQVAITKLFDTEHPIVEGELLINPLFHTRRPVVVAFLGRHRVTTLKCTIDEATRRIKEIGSVVKKPKSGAGAEVVEGDVDIDVDFIITAGEPADYESMGNYIKARDVLGIPIVTANEMFKFLGY